MTEQTKINKMGSEPISRLMLSMGAPIIMSMVLQAVYNIVDSAFISNMPQNGEAGLNALTLAFPVQMLMVAIGIGTGVGANALLAKSLGQQKRDTVNRTAGNAIFLAVIIYAAFFIFGLFGVSFFAYSQTSTPLVAEMTVVYLRICCIFSFGIIFFSIFEKLLQSTGKSVYSTVAQIAGAAANIILDPIMIYGWLGCPSLGVAGAAAATVIGQCISMVLALFFHLKFNKEVESKIKYLTPKSEIIKSIYKIGLPAILAQALMSFMTYGMNLILGIIGDAMVTAYGLFYKIQQFFLFAAFGLRDAIVPITAFNYGAKSKNRVKSSIKFGTAYTLIVMAVGVILLEGFAENISALFGLSGYTQALCVYAMRIIASSFPFAGVNIALQGVFQALDAGTETLVISILRQIALVLPTAWVFAVFAKSGGEWLIFTAFPIAEAISCAVAVLFMIKIWRRKICNVDKNGAIIS